MCDGEGDFFTTLTLYICQAANIKFAEVYYSQIPLYRPFDKSI